MDVIDLTMPRLGETMESGRLVRWLKAPGDSVARGEMFLELETDKTIAELPSMFAGRMLEHLAQEGEDVAVDTVIARLEVESAPEKITALATASSAPSTADSVIEPLSTPSNIRSAVTEMAQSTGLRRRATPAARVAARRQGINLETLTGSGRRQRIEVHDVEKQAASGNKTESDARKPSASTTAGSLPGSWLPWPKIDFSKFGAIEVQTLSRIKKISGQNLARNWVMIPAVTYHEDADITDLEAFRVAVNQENEAPASKITLLAFVIKACQLALKKFPEFNSSLDLDNGEMRLVLKKYIHIAFAADTPNGLQVPVIKDVDQKSVSQIAAECDELARKARDGKLGPADVTGAGFTVSSLGGLGGTSFSPIVNAPEVAILGISRAAKKSVWNGRKMVTRLVLPLSLSADHRVIDGAQATRFNAYLAKLLGDMRRALL